MPGAAAEGVAVNHDGVGVSSRDGLEAGGSGRSDGEMPTGVARRTSVGPI